MGKKFTGKFVEYLFLIVLAVLFLYPILYVIFGSFKGNQELVLGGANIFPKKFIFDNYVQAWKAANFSRFTFNSLFISFGDMVLTLMISSMAGYAFARKNFFAKNFLYNLLIAFMFVNVGSVTLRPLFELAVKMNMNTSLWSVVLISTGGGQATYIFLVRGYMATIPKELDEAAKIDGCGFFTIYRKIIMPVLKPVLATIALLSFRGGWNEYILPLVFTMSKPELQPLTVGVVALRTGTEGAAAWNIMFAGSAISIVPIVIIYIFTSKYFMNGLTVGAVKG
jgi:multiple sugar transport system permease protein